MRSQNVMTNDLRKSLLGMCLLISSAGFAVAQEPRTFDFPHTVVKSGDTNPDRITLNRILRVTPASRRWVIEITVYSDTPFEGGNDTHVLHIGSKKFAWPRAGDTKGHALVFELTPNEFAKLKDGDEVKVTYGSEEEFPDRGIGQRQARKFGKLDKSKIDR